jgi:hypothetical protein
MKNSLRNFQIWLSPGELEKLNTRAVEMTAAKKKPQTLQDVVRAWISAGCPTEQCKPKKNQKK